jgi:FKBP-type peptidyl-prolyl cis-trans isomerase SlyD
MSSLVIGPDTRVTLAYVLFDEHGDAVDQATVAEPLTYIHGYAQIVPGLERALEGLRPGDQREVVIDAEEAFGDHEDEGVFEVDKADFPDADAVEVGDEFIAQAPDGHQMPMRVVEILPDGFRVDMNHPLAGQKVRFEVHVQDVRAASDQEVAEAQAELEERIGHDDGGCGCGHAHGHPGAETEHLVTLGRRSQGGDA